MASNIVPEKVTIAAEVRSHSEQYLAELTDKVKNIFEHVVDEWVDPTGQAKGEPKLTFTAERDFPVMHLERSDRVVQHIENAAQFVGIELDYKVAGGGSDANIFNGYGLQTAIIATGMTHVHSTDEEVTLADMEKLTALLIAIVATVA